MTPSASNTSDPTDKLSDEARDVEGASDRNGPASPLAEAIEGFVNLGAWALREFGTHAQSVGRRIESDAYSPDHVTRDVARSAALVTAAGLRTLNEFVDAVVILARAESTNLATATVPMPERLVGVPCKLRLIGNLRSRFEPPDRIHRRHVSLRGPDLTAGETTFSVIVDATQRPGLNYWGRVLVTPMRRGDESELVHIRVGVR